jgi:branched chain amino acid efflux pump
MEAPLNIWVVMVAAGLITFGIRLSFILLLERVQTPDWFKRSLRFVPPAVLSALILPELIRHNDVVDFSWRNPQLMAGLAAVLVAWRTRNVVLTIAAGMIALVILEAILIR